MKAQTQSPVEIVQASTAAHTTAARELFLEYAGSLGFSLCFQSFDQELAELPGKYALPKGRLLLAFRGAEAVGCVALRPLDDARLQLDDRAHWVSMAGCRVDAKERGAGPHHVAMRAVTQEYA